MGEVRIMCIVCLKYFVKCESGRSDLGIDGKSQGTCYCTNNTLGPDIGSQANKVSLE